MACASACGGAQRMRVVLMLFGGMRCGFLAVILERFRQGKPLPVEAELVHRLLRLYDPQGEILARPAGMEMALVVADLAARLPEPSPVRRHLAGDDERLS